MKSEFERLSQQDKVSKFCMNAGFLSVVEIGQYFVTKDNGEQFYAMACREYTLPRNDGSSQPEEKFLVFIGLTIDGEYVWQQEEE